MVRSVLLFLFLLVAGVAVGHAQPFLPGPERNPRGIPAQGRGEKRVALILYRFANDGRPLPAADTVREKFFTDPDSVHAYFDEVSFGNLRIAGSRRRDGDVFGPYTVPSYGAGLDRLPTRVPEIDAMAHADGFVTSSYDLILYVHPGAPTPFRARSIDSRRIELDGLEPVAAAREMLNLLGLPRADGVRCSLAGTPTSIRGACRRAPRVDPFCIQGMTTEFRHPSTAFKARMGWYEVSNVATVDTRARTRHIYLLEPVERSTSGIQCVRVPIPPHRFPNRYSWGPVPYSYYVEFRQPSPFDPVSPQAQVTNGITVRIGAELDTYHNSFLIDSEPFTSSFEDAPLTVGERFTDERAGITIFTRVTSEFEALVEVQIDGPSDGPHLLWSHEDSVSNLWSIDESGNYRHHKDLGYLVHYDGTRDHNGTATSYQRVDDRTAHLLIAYENGFGEHRVLDRNDNESESFFFGPFPGWTAQSYRELPDGTRRLLWSHEDGRANLWTLDRDNRLTNIRAYGQFPEWTARSYQKLADGTGRLLWSRSNGQASLWTLASDDSYVSYRYYGPFTEWTPMDYEKLSDGTARMLWSRSSGQANLWLLDGNDDYTAHQTFGPYYGWSARCFSPR